MKRISQRFNRPVLAWRGSYPLVNPIEVWDHHGSCKIDQRFNDVFTESAEEVESMKAVDAERIKDALECPRMRCGSCSRGSPCTLEPGTLKETFLRDKARLLGNKGVRYFTQFADDRG